MNLSGVNFKNATLSNITLTNTILTNIAFDNASFTNITPNNGSSVTLSSGYIIENSILFGPKLKLENIDFFPFLNDPDKKSTATTQHFDISQSNLSYTSSKNITPSNPYDFNIIILDQIFEPNSGHANKQDIEKIYNKFGKILYKDNNIILNFLDINSNSIFLSNGAVLDYNIDPNGFVYLTIDNNQYYIIINSFEINPNYSIQNGHILGSYVNLSDSNISNADISNIDLTGSNFKNLESNNISHNSNTQLPSGYIFNNNYIIGADIKLKGYMLSVCVINIQNEWTKVKNMFSEDIPYEKIISIVVEKDGQQHTILPIDGIYQEQYHYYQVKSVNTTSNTFDVILLDLNNISTPFLSHLYDDDYILSNGYKYIDGLLFGKYIDLSNKYINGLDISDVDLSTAVLTGVSIKNITVNSNTILPNSYRIVNGYLLGPDVDLSNIKLDRYINFNNLDLSNATFTNFKSNGYIHFGKDPDDNDIFDSESNYSNITLPSGYIIKHGYLIGPDVDLSVSTLIFGDDGLNSTVLMKNINLMYSHIEGLLHNVESCNFSYSLLQNTKFLSNTDFTGMNFKQSDIQGLEISQNSNILSNGPLDININDISSIKFNNTFHFINVDDYIYLDTNSIVTNIPINISHAADIDVQYLKPSQVANVKDLTNKTIIGGHLNESTIIITKDIILDNTIFINCTLHDDSNDFINKTNTILVNCNFNSQISSSDGESSTVFTSQVTVPTFNSYSIQPTQTVIIDTTGGDTTGDTTGGDTGDTTGGDTTGDTTGGDTTGGDTGGDTTGGDTGGSYGGY
jgi:uncharacterized protein YjbI with pentapeptide repeats